MKIKSLIISGLCAMAMVVVGCTDSTTYSPAAPDVNDGVYFPTSSTTTVALDENQTEFTLKMFRSNVEEAVVVPLGLTIASEDAALFTVPSTVAFAAGQDEADVTIGVDFNSIEADKVYKVGLEVAPAFASTYGLSQLVLNVSYAPWSEWTRIGSEDEFGTYTLTVLWDLEQKVPVFVRQSLTNPDKYQYQVGYIDPTLPDDDDDKWLGLINGDVILTLEYNKADGTVLVPGVSTNVVNTNYNETIQMGGLYWYGTNVNPKYLGSLDPEDVKTWNEFDEESGLFTLYMAYYISLGSFGDGEEYLQLPGYTQYNVKVALNGKYTSQTGETMQVFSIVKSETVSEVKYKVYEGSLSAAQAEANAKTLAADEEAASVKESGNVAVELTNGSYTIVVAGVNASGELKAWDYLTFNFATVEEDPNEGWTSLGEVLYGDDYFPCALNGVNVSNYMVECQQSDETSGLYRLVDPYGEAWPYYGAIPIIEYTTKHNYLYFMIASPSIAMVTGSETGMNITGYDWEMYMSSLAWNNYQNGVSLSELIEQGLVGKFENNKFTMPTRSLFFWLIESSRGYPSNIHDGFQVNFAPEEEEEEPARYTPKAFTNQVKASVKDRMNTVRMTRNYKSMKLDSKTWNEYRMSQPLTNTVSIVK